MSLTTVSLVSHYLLATRTLFFISWLGVTAWLWRRSSEAHHVVSHPSLVGSVLRLLLMKFRFTSVVVE